METLWLPGVPQSIALFLPVFRTVVLTGDLGSTMLHPAVIPTLCEFSVHATLWLVSLSAISDLPLIPLVPGVLMTAVPCSPMASLPTWFLPPVRLLCVVRQLLPLDKLFLVWVVVTCPATLLWHRFR